MEAFRIQDIVVFLAAAGLVIPVVKRFDISPVLGFLFIGLILGPHGISRFAEGQHWVSHILITDVEGVRGIAELGIVFLLFMIGLDLSFDRLWALRRWVFGLGSAQILSTGLVIAIIAHTFGNSLEASVVLGACLALSSTAMVVQLLTEQGRFGSAVGRGSFAVLLAQDIAVVPILFVVGTLGSGVGSSVGTSLGLALGAALLAVAGILLVGRLAVRPLFRFVGATRSPELFMAATLLIIIATTAVTDAAGLSAPLGAFLAGILLAETEFRHEIEVNIEPFKGLLLGLFFVSIGMIIDLAEIGRTPGLIALSVVGLFVIKALITTGLARAFGFATPQAVEMGLLLGQGGEFAFVVVALAGTLGLLPTATAQFILIVVGATLLLTPLLARVARRLGQVLQRRADIPSPIEADVGPNLAAHVVIVGYGRTGRLLAELLNRQRIAHVALDLDSARVAQLRDQGAPVFLGDASRAAMLGKMQLDRAIALVVTMDDPTAALRVVDAARRLSKDLPILARAHDNVHGGDLLSHGASDVVPEVLEAGLYLGQLLLERAGIPADTARDLIEIERTQSLSRFKRATRPSPPLLDRSS